MACNGDGFGFWISRAASNYRMCKTQRFSAKLECLTRVMRKEWCQSVEHVLERLSWTLPDNTYTCIVSGHMRRLKDPTVHFHHFQTDPVVWHQWLHVLKLEESHHFYSGVVWLSKRVLSVAPGTSFSSNSTVTSATEAFRLLVDSSFVTKVQARAIYNECVWSKNMPHSSVC